MDNLLNIINNIAESSMDNSLLVYKSMITSVGSGGNSINIMDYEDEQRNLRPAYPYGFNTSPPPMMDAWVLSENDEDNVIGVVQQDRPQVASGGSMIYSVGGAKVIVQPDGSIDCYTANDKTMKINGKAITTGSGTDENRVREIIDEKVNKSFVINLGFMSEEDIEDYVDDALETFEGWVDAKIINTIAIMTIDAGRVIVDNATNLDQKVTYYDKTIDGFTSAVRGENVTVDTIITHMERYDGTGLYTGKQAPPTLEDVQDGDYYIASEYSSLAGYVYRYDADDGWVLATEYDITQEELEALKKTHRYEHNMVDKYYTKTEVGSQIIQNANQIILYVDSQDTAIDSRVDTVVDTISDVSTRMDSFVESVTQLSARVTVAEGEIDMKASQADLNIVQNSVGELEIFREDAEAQLEILPQQITSTVTTAINNIKIGAENLIINSDTLVYNDYYFDPTYGS